MSSETIVAGGDACAEDNAQWGAVIPLRLPTKFSAPLRYFAGDPDYYPRSTASIARRIRFTDTGYAVPKL